MKTQSKIPIMANVVTKHTRQTAPPQFVEAAGIRFGYRRFGVAIDIPLLFFMHFTATMDH